MSKKIVIKTENWNMIVRFVTAIQIPVSQSKQGAALVDAINSAEEIELADLPEKKE
jgi:hypothetical protein